MILRKLLVILLALVGLGACDSTPKSARDTSHTGTTGSIHPDPADVGRSERGSRAPRPARELTWDFPHSAVGKMSVVVSVPETTPSERLPVLIALHGRGEAFKGPVRGARGWLDDYDLPRALRRLAEPPLTADDFLNSVDPKRLKKLNARLARDPYRGLIVVCPYTPDILAGKRAFRAARPLSEFIVDTLLPRVFAETPAARAQVGIDGVSLGGRAALLVGFERPEAFGVVGALQAAIDAAEIPPLVERARGALVKNPKLELRLLTSDQDYFKREILGLSRALDDASVKHVLTVVPGDHSYEFNRGPGVYEMLTFHNWVQRGEPPL